MSKYYIILLCLLGSLFSVQAQEECFSLPDTIYYSAQDCNAKTKICLPISTGITLSNTTTVTLNSNTYSDTITGCNFDSIVMYNYLTLSESGASDSFELKQWIINEDTFSMQFQTVKHLVDSMNVWDTLGTWVLDTTASNILGGSVKNIYSNLIIKQLQLPDSYVTLDPSYSQLARGTEIEVVKGGHTLIVTDTVKNCADTSIIIVVCTPTAQLEIQTTVGTSDTFCLDTTQLVENVKSISSCFDDSQSDAVSISIDGVNHCISYTAKEEGTETACFIICDHLGICDTTYFNIIVSTPDTFSSPIAKNDTVNTVQETTTAIPVLENDVISVVTSLLVSQQPKNGSIKIEADTLVTYTPNDGFCGDDSLQYIVCNSTGCDSATVFISVACGIKVFTGFSPNDDGVNDRLKILGIEAFPNSSVQIFNIWGNLVYKNKAGESYKNETGWDGKWNGKNLPDGNYFYVIKLNDGSGKKLSGYILLFR